MRWARDGWSVESGIEKGREPPDWYFERPDIPAGLGSWVGYFWELSTERHFGMSLGPIPVSKIRRYWQDLGSFDDDLGRFFERTIQVMDGAYLEWVNESSSSGGSGKSPPRPSPGGWGGKG